VTPAEIPTGFPGLFTSYISWRRFRRWGWWVPRTVVRTRRLAPGRQCCRWAD